VLDWVGVRVGHRGVVNQERLRPVNDTVWLIDWLIDWVGFNIWLKSVPSVLWHCLSGQRFSTSGPNNHTTKFYFYFRRYIIYFRRHLYVTCDCYWYFVLRIAACWQLLLLNEYQSNHNRFTALFPGPPDPPSLNRHHRSCGDCLEGKGENYQVCSVQYCVQKLCTVRCTHIWTD